MAEDGLGEGARASGGVGDGAPRCAICLLLLV